MKKGMDFYNVLGVGDSMIRERIFVALADLYSNNDYGEIYHLWMYGADNVSIISNLCGDKAMKCSFKQ